MKRAPMMLAPFMSEMATVPLRVLRPTERAKARCLILAS